MPKKPSAVYSGGTLSSLLASYSIDRSSKDPDFKAQWDQAFAERKIKQPLVEEGI